MFSLFAASCVRSAGHAELVERLCKEGAYVDTQNDNLDTPLHLAAWKGNSEVVTVLLKNGADKNIENADGKTPPQLARTQEMKRLLPEMDQAELAAAIEVVSESDDDEA